MNIYLESNFLDEFGVADEYDGQRNSEAKGVDEDYVPGMLVSCPTRSKDLSWWW